MVMINRWRVEQAGDPGDFLDAAHAAVESWNADERFERVRRRADGEPPA